MANFTASTALRDATGTKMASCYYWVTLHEAGQTFVASDTYSAGVRGELATANGYTRGGQSVTLTSTNGVLDSADVVWTASGGSLTAGHVVMWVSTTNSISGAGLVSVGTPASAQTATDGRPMTATVNNPITYPTPA